MKHEFLTDDRTTLNNHFMRKDKDMKAWRQATTEAHDAVRQTLIPPPNPPDLAGLPRYSALLRVLFRLSKPYLSKDDKLFYPIDNAVRKEWVFKTPLVAATSWKGAWRAALWHGGHREDDTVTRLLGVIRGKDDTTEATADTADTVPEATVDAADATPEASSGTTDTATPTPPDSEAESEEIGQAGCLYFFPTFFNKSGEAKAADVVHEVINPHKREMGVGTLPIPFEAVGAGARGVLSVLYVPLPGQGAAELAADLPLLAQTALDVLTVYGFGAKTSDGYGTAERESLRGDIAITLGGPVPEFWQFGGQADHAKLPKAAAAAVAKLQEATS